MHCVGFMSSREGQLENGDKINWEAPHNSLRNPRAEAGGAGERRLRKVYFPKTTVVLQEGTFFPAHN